MSAPRKPPVVAELGRPETPGEAADRKAQASRKHRANQTLPHLVLALLASLLVVLVAVLIVVRPDPAAQPDVDYRTIAAEADSPAPLAAPDLPPGWSANSAVYHETPADGVATWYVGFITPQNQFIGVRQGIDANPTWQANQLGNRTATGTRAIDGVLWQVYDYRHVTDVGNLAYALAATGPASDLVLFGTASPQEFEELAATLARIAG